MQIRCKTSCILWDMKPYNPREWTFRRNISPQSLLTIFFLLASCLACSSVELEATSSSAVKVKNFTSPYHPDLLWGPLSLISTGYRRLSGRDAKLITHL
jgi:hypothetical protein